MVNGDSTGVRTVPILIKENHDYTNVSCIRKIHRSEVTKKFQPCS